MYKIAFGLLAVLLVVASVRSSVGSSVGSSVSEGKMARAWRKAEKASDQTAREAAQTAQRAHARFKAAFETPAQNESRKTAHAAKRAAKAANSTLVGWEERGYDAAYNAWRVQQERHWSAKKDEKRPPLAVGSPTRVVPTEQERLVDPDHPPKAGFRSVGVLFDSDAQGLSFQRHF